MLRNVYIPVHVLPVNYKLMCIIKLTQSYDGSAMYPRQSIYVCVYLALRVCVSVCVCVCVCVCDTVFIP